MALINTLRNKMGKVVVGVVAFAILSFILADLLGPNSIITGGGVDTTVGEIAGVEISQQEFNAEVEVFAQNYQANFGRSPSEAEMSSIRNQAWEMLIVQNAFEKEYKDLGVTVGEDELVDMVQGKNISPDLTTAPIFMDPNTGQFDKAILTRFLADLGQQNPQMQLQWYNFERNLVPSRMRVKYENMLNKSIYVTEEEGKAHYFDQVSLADISYAYIPFTSVPDSLISFTDQDLETYLQENSDDYQTEASKTIKYVKFDVIPSADDSAFARVDLEGLLEEFKEVEDDSIYARLQSDGLGFYNNYTVRLMPNYLQDRIDDLEVGAVFGPHQEGSAYKLYKVSKVEDDTLTAARAKHILFKWEEDTPEEKANARREAQRVLREIQNGADFGEMAKEYGTDGTANRGGDLGWFQTGGMVADFQNAVFSATRPGLLNNVVETEFGYHIIDVTHTKVNKKYTISTIERTLFASDATRNAAFRLADFFGGTSTNYREFLENAEADSIQVLEASNITAEQRNIAALTNSRQIVRWLYTEASLNEVSEVFELDDSYVIVVLTDEVEMGTQDIETVKFRLESRVGNDKKFEFIKNKLASLSGNASEKAAAYGSDAQVLTMTSLKAEDNLLTTAGSAPEAVGTVFGMENGETSEPIQTLTGVVVITVDNITPAGEVADYSAYIDQVSTARNSRSSYNATEAIKEAANIKDERYKFY